MSCCCREVPVQSRQIDDNTIADARVEAVSLSSDFHKGRGIPIGTTLKTRGVTVPQAVGTDVNCGMRLHLTGLTLEQVEGHLDALEHRLRHIFFQGGRGIGLTQLQREAMLREGIPGLLSTDALTGEAWLAAADELNRINDGGGRAGPDPFGDPHGSQFCLHKQVFSRSNGCPGAGGRGR